MPRPDPGRRAEQPTSGSVWIGAGGQGARGGIRRGRDPTPRRASATASWRCRPGADAASAIKEMRGILARYAATGVPAELVEAAKRQRIGERRIRAQLDPGARQRVVERARGRGPGNSRRGYRGHQARHRRRRQPGGEALSYAMQNSITAMLKPVPTGQPVATKGFGGAEQVTSAPTKPVQPAFLGGCGLASSRFRPTTSRFRTCSLRTAFASSSSPIEPRPTVSVLGAVQHDFGLQTPTGQEGISDVLDALFSYGSETLDRLAFQQGTRRHRRQRNGGVRVLLERAQGAIFPGESSCSPTTSCIPRFPRKRSPWSSDRPPQFLAGNLKSPDIGPSRARYGVAAGRRSRFAAGHARHPRERHPGARAIASTRPPYGRISPRSW